MVFAAPLAIDVRHLCKKLAIKKHSFSEMTLILVIFSLLNAIYHYCCVFQLNELQEMGVNCMIFE